MICITRFVRGFPDNAFIDGNPLEYAHARGLSLVRWGDGESNILHGMSVHFQRYDPGLAEGLRRLLVNPRGDILIGIPRLPVVTNILRHLSVRIWLRTRLIWSWYGSSHAKFADALALREYPTVAINTLREILSRKAWCILVCANAQDGEVLDCNGVNLSHIGIAAQDCYDCYDETLDEIRHMIRRLREAHVSNDGLVLIAAGPSAKLWAYDLAADVAVYDIGHLFQAAVRPAKTPLWRG